MELSTWEAWYQNDDTPWDKGEPAPGLVDFLNRHTELERCSVCVPGCGTGHDAREWAAHGFEVTGYDFAPTAIKRARKLANNSDLKIHLIQEDFLSARPPKRFDWVFEHTLLSAIDPSRRPEYFSAIPRFVKPGGHFLAIHFIIPDIDEPPFGISREEIMDRMLPHFDLIDEWVPRSWPNRVGEELMFWWRRKTNDETGEDSHNRLGQH